VIGGNPNGQKGMQIFIGGVPFQPEDDQSTNPSVHQITNTTSPVSKKEQPHEHFSSSTDPSSFDSRGRHLIKKKVSLDPNMLPLDPLYRRTLPNHILYHTRSSEHSKNISSTRIIQNIIEQIQKLREINEHHTIDHMYLDHMILLIQRLKEGKNLLNLKSSDDKNNIENKTLPEKIKNISAQLQKVMEENESCTSTTQKLGLTLPDRIMNLSMQLQNVMKEENEKHNFHPPQPTSIHIPLNDFCESELQQVNDLSDQLQNLITSDENIPATQLQKRPQHQLRLSVQQKILNISMQLQKLMNEKDNNKNDDQTQS
jgi:hypothetical protein